MQQLQGRTAIVTGASRGIGAHIARALSREGVVVALVARSADAIAQLASELSQAGARAIAIGADLSDRTQLDRLLDRAHAELGPIDILVNNAGIDAMRCYPQESDAQTEEMIELDLLIPMLLTRKLLPKMLARKTGHIVNIASLAGKTAMPYCVSYSAAKAGLIGFSNSLRSELQGSGVSASVVCPGFVVSEGMFAEKQRAHGLQVSPLLGTSLPQDVAAGVLLALRQDRGELVINPGPMRLMQALNQLAPEAMNWLQTRIGVNGMLRGVALSEDSQSAATPPANDANDANDQSRRSA
jgi:short-subunit dehydrogenase